VKVLVLGGHVLGIFGHALIEALGDTLVFGLVGLGSAHLSTSSLRKFAHLLLLGDEHFSYDL